MPLRAEAAESAEMVTQLLFGESYEVLQTIDRWAFIRSDVDGYEGWVDQKLVVDLSLNEVNRWRNWEHWIVPGPFMKIVTEPEKHHLILPGGSCVAFNGEDRNSFVIGSNEYYLAVNSPVPGKKTGIEEVAMSFIHAPYLWGGKTFMGMDCSGLSQVVYRIFGQTIPRNASQQVELGTTVSFVEEAKAGDLAFFDNEEGEITHVGLCLGGGDIIHASGFVRVDKLDHQGIFDVRKRKYSHKLRVIKRILS
jgi:hypothetical protein